MKADEAAILTWNMDAKIEDLDIILTSNNYVFVHVLDQQNILAGRSMIKAAHQDKHIKRLVSTLSQAGFYVYHTVDGVSKFVKHEHIPNMWHSVANGTYAVSPTGVVHTLELPPLELKTKYLIVVFSSIGGDIFGDGLFRFFTQNYRSVRKFVPHDTAILRIADIGGVVSAFYLNTKYRPDNAARISDFIEKTRLDLGVPRESVITYGASKGATGALYHALQNGYRCVCVEPIVNDKYYEEEFGDSHFTTDGNFPRSKEDVFLELMAAQRAERLRASGVPQTQVAVIYSEQSPQYPYIRDVLVKDAPGDMCFINLTHPGITDHPDVSPLSLNILAMLLNMMFYGFSVPVGNFSIHTSASN